MVPVLQPLPLDLSGISPNNRTKREVHNIADQYGLPYRIVVLDKGYFYTNDLVVTDNLNKVLVINRDYQCIILNKDIAKITSKTACAVILITNPNIGSMVYVSAQMVGGEYTSLNPAIIEAAKQALKSTNRKVYWKNIQDKPESYRPSGHLHAYWDLYGFTEPTGIVNRMVRASGKITQSAFAALYDEYLRAVGTAGTDMIEANSLLKNHIENYNDPHDVTATQVGLGNVVNAPVATVDQARNGQDSVMMAYATPLRATQSIESNFGDLLKAHIANYNNPHNDTASALGTLTVQEVQLLANKYYDLGSVVDKAAKLGGKTPSAFYTDARKNIPINQIKTGFLDWSVYSESPPRANTIAVPANFSGQYGWLDTFAIFQAWEKKVNRILYCPNLIKNYTGVNSGLTAAMGTNYPDGTICFYRAYDDFVTSSGSGNITTRVVTVGAAQYGLMLSGSKGWFIPGWPT